MFRGISLNLRKKRTWVSGINSNPTIQVLKIAKYINIVFHQPWGLTVGNQFVALDMTLIKSASLKGNELSVLTTIVSFLPAPFPSIPTIMKRSGLSRNTVLKYLKTLTEKRIIKRLKRIGSSNFYEINPALVCRKVYDKMKSAIKKYVDDFNAKFKGGVVPKPGVGGSTKFRHSNYIPSVSVTKEKPFHEFLKTPEGSGLLNWMKPLQ